ncbi:MAG: radical SAM family heme chaperone HemW [Pseudomonadota bacterium]
MKAERAPTIGGGFDDGTPGFGLYIHWPFCAAKCPYCDFNSHVRRQPPNQAEYASAFKAELAHMRALTGPKALTSIFIGGGTPSLMAPSTVDAVLSEAERLWGFADMPAGAIEITMEANPSSVEAERFRGYRAAGVNRVSLGVQSLNDDDLKWLGRLHSADEARHAIGLARDIFPRMSFDLIYARARQTEDAWQAELEEAIALAADHLSLYQLTIEPGTAFWGLAERGKTLILPPDDAAHLYEVTQAVTTAHGLPSYEISNHAKPGCESRHNLTYWRQGDYVGVGPGAHGRIAVDDVRTATATEANPEAWLGRVASFGHGITETDALTPDEQADEMLLMGLRLREGLDLPRYEALRGEPISQDREAHLQGHGLLERLGNSRLRATEKGALLLDALVADLAG